MLYIVHFKRLGRPINMKRVNMQIVSWVVCVTQKLNHRIFFYSILLEKLSPSLSSIQLYKHSSSLLWLLRCLFPPDCFSFKNYFTLSSFISFIFAAKNLDSLSLCAFLPFAVSPSVPSVHICFPSPAFIFASLPLSIALTCFPRSLLSNALTPCLFLLYLTFFLKRCQNI